MPEIEDERSVWPLCNTTAPIQDHTLDQGFVPTFCRSCTTTRAKIRAADRVACLIHAQRTRYLGGRGDVRLVPRSGGALFPHIEFRAHDSRRLFGQHDFDPPVLLAARLGVI